MRWRSGPTSGDTRPRWAGTRSPTPCSPSRSSGRSTARSARCPVVSRSGWCSRPCCAAATRCCCWTSRTTSSTCRPSDGSRRSSLRRPRPCCTSATTASSSRSWLTYSTVLGDATSSSSNHRLVGTSRKLSGSSSSSTSSLPRSRASSTSRFCSPPDNVRTSRYCARSNGMESTASVTLSQPTSAWYPPTSAHSASACAYRIWVGSSSTCIMASSAAFSSAAAARTADGASEASRSRTERSSSIRPTVWRMMPRPPLCTTAPVWSTSPATIRSSVVLPAPFGPISAIRAPSPTRSWMPLSSGRPSGSTYPTSLISTCPTRCKCAHRPAVRRTVWGALTRTRCHRGDMTTPNGDGGTPATSPDPESGAEGDTDQLTEDDTLLDRGVDDLLDEGYSPPEHRSGHRLETELEQERGESLDERLAEEEPEVWETDPGPDAGASDPDRAGRLTAADPDASGESTVSTMANDVGFAGGAASAEEAAIHVLDDDDPGLEDDDTDADEQAERP